MGSTVVRLTAGDPAPATLALVVGVALARVVAAVAPDVPIQLKWPNDLLVAGAKCAGILLERTGDAVVVGVGVNLVSAPDLPEIGRAHVCTPVTNATLVCRLLLEQKTLDIQ